MKIFLSSTYRDLVNIRRIAINYLQGITGHITNATGEVVAMEFFNASESTCKEECLSNLDDCNLVIGIYGINYGSIDDETSLSMTELEFDYATNKNIPLLAFVMHTDYREEREKFFIENKIYKRGLSCAPFENDNDFLNRLDSSLKQYLKTYDGYSVDSLWSHVKDLKDNINTYIAMQKSGFDLLMLPYSSGQEDLALEDILHSTYSIRNYISNFEKENSALHSYAYIYQMYPENISSEDLQTLLHNIQNKSTTILQNWETINIGLYNHITQIILATTYLRLCRMQHRLLTEPWTEALRQQVIQVRTLYLETINTSKYVD